MLKSIRASAALWILVLAGAAYAQAPVGIISGTVTDSTGAVIPNASVTITNKATNETRTIAANGQGLYSAPALQAGEYEVKAEMQGFRTVVRNAQVVAGGDTTVDLSLSVGETREVVTVEAASAQVNYDSHSVVGTIARENIQDLPLNGRSSLQLASLEPGVTVAPGSTSQFNAQFNITILGSSTGNGARLTMDGGIINDEVEGGTSMNFSQEVVQEFQLASVNFDTSTGIAASGAMNIVTRSGGNDFHGSAYFYYRDHNLAAYPGLARNTFNPNPFFARRNPGVWGSGPIKKDKLFFFGSYEHINQTSVITDLNDLPSLQPLNAIWPSPLVYNWITIRFDYHISEKNSAFLRYSHDGNHDFGPYNGTGDPSAWVFNTNWSDQSIMGLTTIFSSNVVNDFRAAFHYWQNEGPNATAADCVSPCIGTGLPSIISMVGSATYTYGAGNDPNGPQFHLSKSAEVNDTLSWQKGTHRIRFGMDYEYLTTLYKPWDVCDPACLSVYSVEQTLSQGKLFPAGAFASLPTAIRTTNDLLNLPVYNSTASIYSGVGIGNGTFPSIYDNPQGGQTNRIHPWVGDTWKVKPSLTLNAGLGYDLETGIFSSFLGRPQYLAPIFEGQTGGAPYGLGKTQPDYLDFTPTVGFAWAIGKDKKTVIRGGAGMYWDTFNLWQQFRESAYLGPPGDGRVELAASAFTNTLPGIYYQASTGVQPLPVGAALPIGALSNLTLGDFIQIIGAQIPTLESQVFGNVPKSGPYTVSGIDVTKQGVEIYPAHFPLVRSYQTSIGVQRQLPYDMVLTADWARRQFENVSLGELDLNRYALTSDGLSPVIPKCAVSPDFNVGDECSTGGITVWTPEGRSVYDALLVKLQKRFAHRFQFTASYALQKNVTESATVNMNNYFAAYGPSLARQNFNFSGVVSIPWGFRLSVNSSIITSNPVNPSISGIDLTDSGNSSTPITLASLGLNSGLSYGCFNYGCGKAQLAAAVAAFNTEWAGKKAFNGATIPTLTLPSSYALGAPILSQDFRLTKEFALKEKYRFQLFAEMFNAFNISNLTYATTLNASTFGQPTARVGQASTFGSGGPRAVQVGGRFTF